MSVTMNGVNVPTALLTPRPDSWEIEMPSLELILMIPLTRIIVTSSEVGLQELGLQQSE